MGLVIVTEWTAHPTVSLVAYATTTAAIALLVIRIDWLRRLYVLIGAVLFLITLVVLPDWQAPVAEAFGTASFIAAFFTALMSVCSVAMTSPAIDTCGQFLARQPPGRRYLALTTGGHLFGLVMSYGAISLLGALAVSGSAQTGDAAMSARRVKRMLVAIQRGFVATLPWSPLTFAVAISTTVVPGATWTDAVGPCVVSALILAGTGWAFDTIFKPRPTAPPAPSAQGPSDGTWLVMLSPLLLLLGVLLTGVALIRLTTDMRIIGAVMLVVPVIAVSWAVLQRRGPAGGAAGRAVRYATRDLPATRSELVLLVMAGFIGTLGGRLGAQTMDGIGVDLSSLGAPAVLLGLFWLIPIAGQCGMNPILAVSLLAPLLPSPAALGIDPSVMVVAMTGGWAVSGATSPFTASTILIGSLGRVPATQVGLRWNGPFAAASGGLMCLWILFLAG